MTCKELAEQLMKTPDLPVSVFTGGGIGCGDFSLSVRKLWCGGGQKEYMTIRVSQLARCLQEAEWLANPNVFKRH